RPRGAWASRAASCRSSPPWRSGSRRSRRSPVPSPRGRSPGATCASSSRSPRRTPKRPGSPGRAARACARSRPPSPRRAASRPTPTSAPSTASRPGVSTCAARAACGASGTTPRSWPAACPARASRLRAAVRALQRIDFQTGRLLRLVAQLRLHRAFGVRAFPDYMRERLGCSLRKTRALLALDRRLAELPALAAAYRDGALSFARALVLLPIVHPDTEAAWVERAQQVTVRRLADLVEWALEVEEPGHPVAPPPAEGTLVLPPVQMCARGADAQVRFSGPASVVALLWTAIRAFTPQGAPPWQGFERLLLHVVAEWERGPRHRDPIFERDGWRCAVPACTARASLHDHHVVYRSRGGDHARNNRVAICAAHHLNGIHRFRIRVEGVAPHDLMWQLGVRRGRPPLMVTHGDGYLQVPLSELGAGCASSDGCAARLPRAARGR